MDMAAFGGLPGGYKGATPSGSQAHHCSALMASRFINHTPSLLYTQNCHLSSVSVIVLIWRKTKNIFIATKNKLAKLQATLVRNQNYDSLTD